WERLAAARTHAPDNAMGKMTQAWPQSDPLSDPHLGGLAGSDAGKSDVSLPGVLPGLLAFWQHYRPNLSVGLGNERIWAVLAGSFLVGSAITLLRLLIGLWAVQRCRSRSSGIGDVSLTTLVENLREQMRCLRPVQIRESREVGGAVTIGWL